MTTMRELITGAMRLIRVVAANETPSAEDMVIAQQSFKGLVDNLSTDGLNIYQTTPKRFLMTAGKQSYTLGPAVDTDGSLTGADWITERPVRIEKAVLMESPAIVIPSEPVTPGLAFSANGTSGVVFLHSAASQLVFSGAYTFTDALSAQPNDWDTTNLPTGSTVDLDTFLVPGDGPWTVRSETFFGLPPDLGRTVAAEVVFDASFPADLWIGVCTNGVDAIADPAPAILPFDPNAVGGGQYYALYNPTTGEIRDSLGNTTTGTPAAVGDVIGLVYDNLGSGSPVISCDIVFYLNGVLLGNMSVPYSCFDGTAGRGEIAACVTRGTP